MNYVSLKKEKNKVRGEVQNVIKVFKEQQSGGRSSFKWERK